MTTLSMFSTFNHKLRDLVLSASQALFKL